MLRKLGIVELAGAILIVAGTAASIAYRAELNSSVDWITIKLCEDQPLLIGKYRTCLQHYAPAQFSGDASDVRRSRLE